MLQWYGFLALVKHYFEDHDAAIDVMLVPLQSAMGLGEDSTSSLLGITRELKLLSPVHVWHL